tara:strand:+ start:7896 stop:8306 length:411 start_codon:yes stop_codon:yes gene_type:complete
MLSFSLAINSFAQKSLRWENLSDVRFDQVYSNDLGEYIMMPTFSDEINALDGQEITIKGHIIPLDVGTNKYVLSANPFASCFFCGNSGPETVMELELLEKHTFQTDEYKSFTGILRLNTDDVYSLNYILEKARLVD